MQSPPVFPLPEDPFLTSGFLLHSPVLSNDSLACYSDLGAPLPQPDADLFRLEPMPFFELGPPAINPELPRDYNPMDVEPLPIENKLNLDAVSLTDPMLVTALADAVKPELFDPPMSDRERAFIKRLMVPDSLIGKTEYMYVRGAASWAFAGGDKMRTQLEGESTEAYRQEVRSGLIAYLQEKCRASSYFIEYANSRLDESIKDAATYPGGRSSQLWSCIPDGCPVEAVESGDYRRFIHNGASYRVLVNPILNFPMDTPMMPMVLLGAYDVNWTGIARLESLVSDQCHLSPIEKMLENSPDVDNLAGYCTFFRLTNDEVVVLNNDAVDVYTESRYFKFMASEITGFRPLEVMQRVCIARVLHHPESAPVPLIPKEYLCRFLRNEYTMHLERNGVPKAEGDSDTEELSVLEMVQRRRNKKKQAAAEPDFVYDRGPYRRIKTIKNNAERAAWELDRTIKQMRSLARESMGTSCARRLKAARTTAEECIERAQQLYAIIDAKIALTEDDGLRSSYTMKRPRAATEPTGRRTGRKKNKKKSKTSDSDSASADES